MRKRLALLVFAALPVLAAVPLPTAPTKYVTDVANVLDDAREGALNETLAQYERTTSNQILVYVDRRVPAGTTLEEMGAEAIRTWAVGQAKKDNGAIVFLFVDEHQSRIEVGYGLEGSLTDARSRRILVEVRPLLRNGDYAGAAEQISDRIIATIADPNATPPLEASTVAERKSTNAPPWILFAGLLGFGGIFVFGFIRAIQSQNKSAATSNWRTPSSNDSSSSWSSSDSSSSSSSSSDSSSFSGGGGSGGGGGASDSW
jgi:uncharacterized protein